LCHAIPSPFRNLLYDWRHGIRGVRFGARTVRKCGYSHGPHTVLTFPALRRRCDSDV